MRNPVLLIAMGCLAALISGGACSKALEMTRAASDAENFVGVVILLTIVGLWAEGARRLWPSARRHMQKLGLFVVLASVVLSAACAERIDPGHVGIVVNYYGDDKGVDSFPAVTGMNWYNPVTTSIYEYPTFVQTASWTQDNNDGVGDEAVIFNDKDGLSISVDISLSYQLDGPKAPSFYVKFRSTDLGAFTHGFMRNIARDAFNEVGIQYTAEQIYGQEKEKFLAQVRDRINRQVTEYGIVIQQFGVIGAMRLPQNVVTALNNKIQATQDAQRIENELRSAQAEAQKKIAEAEGDAQSQIVRAKATAESNRLITESVSAQMLEWRRIEVQEKTLWRWNGAMPSTVLNGNVPMVMPGIK